MEQFLAFLGVALLVIVTPGQDTALTIRNVLLGGRRAGLFTAAGVAAGQASWSIAASAGVAALLLASAPAFAAVKVAGAAYLVLVGARSLLAALRPAGGWHDDLPDMRPSPRVAAATALRQGLLSNLGNPKMAVFFTSLLPQFAPAGRAALPALLGLGMVFSVLTFAWLTAYAFAIARAGDVLRRPGIRRALDGVMGAVLVALGLRLAVTSR